MPKNKKLTKIKNKQISRKTRTTSDLIILHASRHLSQINPNQATALGVFAFALAGLAVMFSAFMLVGFSAKQRTHDAFTALDTLDYASQEAFYEAGMHASAYDLGAIQAEIRATSQADELSKTFSALSALVLIFTFWYLHKEHGLLDRNRAGFRIRKIR